MENEAYDFLKDLQRRNIQIVYKKETGTLGVGSTKVTREDVQKMARLREDIMTLLDDDPEQFKVYAFQHGPGSELKQLLTKFGIHSKANCSCNKRATYMDQMGNDWVEKNIDTVVGWLEEEAKKRRLPFLKTAGKILVKKAIANSRKKQKGS